MVESVDITKFKETCRKLPQDSMLRSLVLSQSDKMSPSDFVSKAELWIQVIDRELH